MEFAPYTETKIGTVSCTTPIEFLVHADNILLVRHESADPICLTITMEGDEPVTLNNVASGDQIGVVACHGSQRLVIQKE
ncbi:hypothetical protein K8942_03540 [Candidatus Peribacteria bacterium]|nr:MAG: hypothetical protein K8942_03540 [Candidatus Peribacteria bacterium]